MREPLKPTLDNGKPRCQVYLQSTGKQCEREATATGLLCGLHHLHKPGDYVVSTTQLKKVMENDIKNKVHEAIEYFPEYEDDIEKIENIRQKVKELEQNPELNNLDHDIAYLRLLRNRIESDERLSEPAKIELLNKNIKETYSCLEKRAKIIQILQFNIEIDQFRVFVKKIVSIIDNVVRNTDQRQEIKKKIIETYRSSIDNRNG